MQGHRAAVLLILAAALLAACERMETVESFYSSFGEAVKAGAIGDGKWIPELVPPSAREIREAHNLDTNEVWLSFGFNAAELQLITRQCTRIAETALVRARKRPGKWWPETLVRESKSKKFSDSYEHHECGKKTFLSLDNTNERAYYWTL